MRTDWDWIAFVVGGVVLFGGITLAIHAHNASEERVQIECIKRGHEWRDGSCLVCPGVQP